MVVDTVPAAPDSNVHASILSEVTPLSLPLRNHVSSNVRREYRREYLRFKRGLVRAKPFKPWREPVIVGKQASRIHKRHLAQQARNRLAAYDRSLETSLENLRSTLMVHHHNEEFDEYLDLLMDVSKD